MEYVSIPVIVVLCYFIGEFSKIILGKKEERYKFIPVIVGLTGGVLGCIAYFACPEIMVNVNNPFIAIIVGIISGLASTGGNQVVKQLFSKKNKNLVVENEEDAD
ncbi:MAG TPA: phage holin family protein [Candidatus Pelethenecus sp.]|nr:phage holin family protein [Candidatus Pelethenecus sp.]